MKPDKAVLKEVRRVAVGVAALVAVMLGAFAILGRFDWTVLCGGLYTGVLGVANFFVMGLTVQSITEQVAERKRTDEEIESLSRQMEARMKLSRSLRMFALLGLVVIGIALLRFQPLATILPIVFPSIVVKCLQIIELKKASAVKGGEGL